MVPQRLQFDTKRLEIFDDTVMHYRHFIGGVRMRVGFRRHTMRRPAGVADAGAAFQRLRFQQRLKR